MENLLSLCTAVIVILLVDAQLYTITVHCFNDTEHLYAINVLVVNLLWLGLVVSKAIFSYSIPQDSGNKKHKDSNM